MRSSLSSLARRPLRKLARALLPFVSMALCTLGAGSALAAASAGVPLADSPLFSAAAVPANVLLELSVEYPTALSVANSANFNPTGNATLNLGTGIYNVNYVGYFDPLLCYTYHYSALALDGITAINTNQPTGANAANNYYAENAPLNDSEDYFVATSVAGSYGTCNGQWSGAFLNWAGMQTIDPFRWALTGGYRSYDTSTTSILKKAWASGDGGAGETPVQTIPTSVSISNYTPFTWSSLTIRLWGLGTRMQFTAKSSLINGTNQDTSETAWLGSAALQGDTATLYSVKIRVKACDNSFSASYQLPSWCTTYGNNSKPEGLIQQYSVGATTNGVYKPPSIRFGAMGYLNDGILKRDAGVLRAKMEFVGPTAPTPGNVTANNARPEWNTTTGVFYQDPDSTDTAATNTNKCTIGGVATACASYSGVVNYLNDFGEISHKYKTYDPVNELYYAGIRYFKADGTGGGNVPEWSNLAANANGTISSDSLYTMVDSFPVIQTWDDPILYACQKNFVLGIGDVNAHSGGNVAGAGPSIGGSTQDNLTYEPPTPALVAADVSMNSPTTGGVYGAVSATNYVGATEGMGASLGTTIPYWCCSDDNTYLMAGLAYDSHTTDMRPQDFVTNDNLDSTGKKLQIQTVSTYWLDVQENQTYRYRNMFWLAAKYGGFTVPAGYTAYTSPFPGTCTAPCTQVNTSWSHSTDAGQPGGSGAAMPDNYYGAGNAQNMVAGLTNAFASIATSASATTTGLASSNYNSVGTSFGSYAVQYDESTWSSDITAYNTLFDANGQPTTTAIWDTKKVVSGYTVSSGTTTNSYLGQFSVVSCGTTGTSFTYGWMAPGTGACSNAGSRVVATYRNDTGVGVPFETASLTGATNVSGLPEKAALYNVPNSLLPVGNINAAPLLNYLRGDQSNEYPLGYQFRPRTFLQGDVVNSSLVPVGPPSLFYTQTNDPGYPTFASGPAATRSTVVYVGGNDGMLHAYQGSLTPSSQGVNSFTPAGGSEMFAYVPSDTFTGPDNIATDAGLAALANPRFYHHYYVDSTPVVTDVDLNNVNRLQNGTFPPSRWITQLIGGLGKGGQSYYSLDVTNPDFNKLSEANLASKVLWEFTDPTMGYSFGQAVVAKTAQYGWTVILLSGMNACTPIGTTNNCAGLGTDTANGHSYIYLINPATGRLYQDPILVSNSVGTLAQPQGAAFPSDLQDSTDGTTDALYFGDLLGNLWRLDLRVGTLASANAYVKPDLIAQLTDAGGNPQPITTRPSITVDPNNGNRYVSVGTGRLLSSADLNTTSQQTFYTFFDGTATSFLPATTSGFPLTRTGTVRPLTNLDGTAAPATVCGVQTNTSGVVFGANAGGWYFDVGVYGSGATTCRINIPAAVDNQGSITFAANIPSGSVCNPSGSNQIFAFALGSGTPLIVNNLGNVVTVGYTAAGGAVSSFSLFNNNGSSSTQATTNGGTNNTVPLQPAPDSTLNRLNWREVPAVD